MTKTSCTDVREKIREFCEPPLFRVQTTVTCTSSGENANPVSVTIVYNFIHCVVYVSGDGNYTETIYHDGTKVTAVPEPTEEYKHKARRYGYGEDSAALTREHEILHTYLAERLRGGASHALWAVAHNQQGYVAPIWEQEEEETLVLAFQQYLNGDEPAEVLLAVERDYGVSLSCLKEEAHKMLRRILFPL